MPTLMAKLEISDVPSLGGLVVPTGYTFNTDGTSIYMTLSALLCAGYKHAADADAATDDPAVAVLTSKGASGCRALRSLLW